jgi:hypothetical protein|tara:strand:- start:42 stop:755 length:714 start_codon:yes stop_codon:yes gene_type:complete
MLKIAFIGDSFSAYRQDGQYNNHWSWKLSQQFPQHQYYNYAWGGRGTDLFQWSLLDAKLKDIDIIFVNRPFKHRVAQLHGDGGFNFEMIHKSDNYQTLELIEQIWFSGQEPHKQGRSPFNAVVKEINISLANRSISNTSQDYHNKWFDSIDSLYNFKHIIKLELLPFRSNSAQHQLQAFHNLPINIPGEERRGNALFDAGITVSPTDTHWSPSANDWVLENYILTPEIVDILNNGQR